MEDYIEESAEGQPLSLEQEDRWLRRFILQGERMKWAAARLCFFAYMSFALLTLVGGHLTAPIMSWYIYGDWRFWRHWQSAKGLQMFGYRMVLEILKGTNGGFLLSVPLTAPPAQSVDHSQTMLNPTWLHGDSCGPCTNCCTGSGCPILNPETGLCTGYNAFTWRYFNCGRYPSHQKEIEYYGCGKWLLRGKRGKSRSGEEYAA